MATLRIAGRSTSTLIRATLRPATATTRRIPASASFRSWSRPNFTLRPSRPTITSPSSSRFVRRELSSILPVHSAIAAARLISKLPTDATTSAEGRFANYLSPI